MNNDIVTRLREKYKGQLPICAEAADEIERLQVENATLKCSLEEVARERDRWMGQTF